MRGMTYADTPADSRHLSPKLKVAILAEICQDAAIAKKMMLPTRDIDAMIYIDDAADSGEAADAKYQ